MTEECKHDNILHESKRRSVCKDCGVLMTRHRGDWIADPNDVAQRRKKESESNERPAP